MRAAVVRARPAATYRSEVGEPPPASVISGTQLRTCYNFPSCHVWACTTYDAALFHCRGPPLRRAPPPFSSRFSRSVCHCVRRGCRGDADPLGYRRFCARSHPVHTLLPCHPAYGTAWRLLARPACDHSLRSRSVPLFCSSYRMGIGGDGFTADVRVGIPPYCGGRHGAKLGS